MSDIFILDEENKKNPSSKTLKTESSLLTKIDEFLLSKQSLTVKDKVIFFRLLSTMINAGITLSK